MFTDLELAACAEREVAMREWVYPGRIAAKKMSEKKARLEIEMMKAIAERFRNPGPMPDFVTPEQFGAVPSERQE